jgi:hypothetical protein
MPPQSLPLDPERISLAHHLVVRSAFQFSERSLFPAGGGLARSILTAADVKAPIYKRTRMTTGRELLPLIAGTAESGAPDRVPIIRRP